jgi:phospholipid transport system substrate-binding protein
LITASLVLIGALTAGALRAETPQAQQVVQKLNTTLLGIMQSADELGYDGRYRRLEPVLAEAFAFPFMTRLAVGPAWAELDETQRARLTELFSQMSTANFAAKFDGFSGERFEIVGEAPGPRDAVVVKDRLVRPADRPVELHFVLRAFEDGWQIIDVLLDAKFSELARQRAEFAAVLRTGGYPELSALLEQKINQFAAQS